VTASPSTAAHLADIDARYDAHLAALRQHAAQLQATVARGAAEREHAAPEPESEPTS
jgi:LmbE family N-acetylglucosaminyl deacetylase